MNEIDRLPQGFKTELANIMSASALSGVIPPGRRDHVLGEIARLKAKYQSRLETARQHHRPDVVDRAQRAIAKMESETAAHLAA